MNTLMTIGYEGANIDDFVASLKSAGVKVLIDIRQLPISRKRGFAKTALSNAMANAGMEYIHIKALGDPKEGRIAARSGDMELFEKIFRTHLSKPDSMEAVHQAIEIAMTSPSCLLCFERDFTCCHRAIVAECMLEHSDLKIRHLGVRKGLAQNEACDDSQPKPISACG